MFGDTLSIVNDMQAAVGYVRVSTERQADQGVSLDAQDAKVRAMATVQGATLVDVIVDGGESAKSLNSRDCNAFWRWSTAARSKP
jgi:hypothetical protein